MTTQPNNQRFYQHTGSCVYTPKLQLRKHILGEGLVDSYPVPSFFYQGENPKYKTWSPFTRYQCPADAINEAPLWVSVPLAVLIGLALGGFGV